MPGVPSDVMIVTSRSDDYKHYAKGTAQENATPPQYAQGFTAYHAAESKSYRISAIASCGCDREDNGDPDCDRDDDVEREEAGMNAYQQLTASTSGVYYPWSSSADVAGYLHDYAKKVIFRAYVFAKTHLKLTKQPTDPNGIQVTLGGTPLPSGTWEYEPGTNTIHIHWDKIDPKLIVPGAKIEITYKVS
jgi:hypothetical protein